VGDAFVTGHPEFKLESIDRFNVEFRHGNEGM